MTIIIRVTEQDGPVEGRFRDVTFDNLDEASRFRAMAREDGTYWGTLPMLVDAAEPAP